MSEITSPITDNLKSADKSTAPSPRQWVLVRGIMSESFHWWDFVPRMRARFPNDSFYTADILGNGQNNHQLTPIGIKSNILGLKQQAPPTGKKILVGFSLGAMLSLEWANAHPEEIEAVVLINCSLNNSRFFERMRFSSFAQIVKMSLNKDPIQREIQTLRMTTSLLSDEKIALVADQWGTRGEQYPVKKTNFVRQSLLAAQVSQRVAPPAPTLILCSGKDQVVHPNCSKRIARKWALPLFLHPEAGHDLTLDDPDWALDRIDIFLNEL